MNEKILANISLFVKETVIASGHGWDYREALLFLLNGNEYLKVKEWYGNRIGE